MAEAVMPTAVPAMAFSATALALALASLIAPTPASLVSVTVMMSVWGVRQVAVGDSDNDVVDVIRSNVARVLEVRRGREAEYTQCVDGKEIGIDTRQTVEQGLRRQVGIGGGDGGYRSGVFVHRHRGGCTAAVAGDDRGLVGAAQGEQRAGELHELHVGEGVDLASGGAGDGVGRAAEEDDGVFRGGAGDAHGVGARRPRWCRCQLRR